MVPIRRSMKADERRGLHDHGYFARASGAAYRIRGSLLRSAHTARLASAKDRLSPEIVLLLFVSAIAATILVWREQGIAGRAEIAGTPAFIVLVSLTVSVNLVLNQPGRGFVTVSQEPIGELIATMPKQVPPTIRSSADATALRSGAC